VSNHISRRRVLANKVFSQAEFRVKDPLALLNRTSQLLAPLPDYLSEVRRNRVVGMVRRRFIRPRLYGGVNVVRTTGSRRQVLSIRSKCAARMFKHTLVGPLLRFARELVVPLKGSRAMLGPERVVRAEVGLDVRH